jgi:prepilin-type N-terminal cleavage/methylation domain-containing protein
MSSLRDSGRPDRRAFPHPARTAIAVPTLPIQLRRPPPRCRRGFTLLELLVVLVLLGLAATFVLPSLRIPAGARGESTALERARATAVRRGEAVRLRVSGDGGWTVQATADTSGSILLAGTGADASTPFGAQSIVVSALGTCLPEGVPAAGSGAWDPARCSAARR